MNARKELGDRKELTTMKITCNREKMLHAFQTVAAIAPARSPKAILQNVKLEVRQTKPRSWPPTSKSASATK